jgi:hypothetical protein
MRRGEQWAGGQETIERLFELVQLDIWASLASTLALPSAALPDMDRSALAAYVKEEQDIYADFAQRGAKVLLRQDRELQQGGSEAVAAVCAQIEQAFKEETELLLASSTASPGGSTAEEVARLRRCQQQSGSMLELYQSASTIKEAFENVTKLYSFLL